jgi:hypothetical protein
MPNAVDLTTLTDLKNYISPTLGTTTASDAILAKIITAVSLGINQFCSRTLAYGVYSEVRNGSGRESMRPLVYPIISVTSVAITNQAGQPGQTIYPASSTNNATGNTLTNDKWFIYLNGGGCGVFTWGQQNVTLNYTAGYITPGQLQLLTLPAWTAGAPIAQNQQIQVGGFYYTALNAGTTGSPTTPTFLTATNSVTNDNGVIWICSGAVFTFPPNAPMLPGDFTQACLQQSALLFKNRTRVGDTGSGVGPDRINYFLKGAHPSTIDLLTQHREVFPTEGMGIN